MSPNFAASHASSKKRRQPARDEHWKDGRFGNEGAVVESDHAQATIIVAQVELKTRQKIPHFDSVKCAG